jgi:DNA polymerase elongation subunit (family B)
MWIVDDDLRHRYIKEKPSIDYYVLDKTGKSPHRDIYGNSMMQQTSKDVFAMKDFLKISRSKTCEVSLSEEVKYLHRKFGTEEIKVDINQLQICTLDIEVAADKFPKAEKAEYPVNLISAHFSRDNQIYTFGTKPYTGNDPSVKNYRYFADEKTMLESFTKFFKAKKVDIITGWNCDLFDMPYLINRAYNLHIDDEKFSYSPVGIYREKKTVRKKSTISGGYEICGVSIIDGLSIYKKFEQKKRVKYSLEAIGQIEVNEGKKKFTGSINKLHETDWNLFVEYNIQDVVLTKKINDKKKYIELAVRFCYGALIPFEKVFSSIAVITGYIVKFLHGRGMLYPDPPDLDKEPYPGGYVMAMVGYYRYMISFDFESLYPSIMIMSNICPSTLVCDPTPSMIAKGNLIKTPASDRYTCETKNGGVLTSEGIYYNKDRQGVVPQIVEEIFGERKYWKNLGKCADGIKDDLSISEIANNYGFTIEDATKYHAVVSENNYDAVFCDTQQYVRKILINSFYGVLGSKYFGFYNPKNASAVTIWARTIIQHISKSINEYTRANWHLMAKDVLGDAFDTSNVKPVKEDVVVLIDTDSNYVHLKPMMSACGIKNLNNEDFRTFANLVSSKFLNPMFTTDLEAFTKSYNIDVSKLNFKQEKIISQMFIVAMKKYAVECVEKEGKVYADPQIHVTGIEVVRTDTPEFCTPKIKESLRLLFESMNKDIMLDYIRKVKAEFYVSPIDMIATPKTVNEYDEWIITNGKINIAEYAKTKKIPTAPLHCPQHVKASMYFNYMIERFGWSSEAPVSDNTKVKYIYVKPNNILKTNVIAFTGEWTENFDKYFVVDYELQFYKKFASVIERFFHTMGWGDVNLDTNDLGEFVEF